MRALLQRVAEAAVKSDQWPHERAIGPGLVIFLGVTDSDTLNQSRELAAKAAHLRIFSNAQGKFDHSVLDIQKDCLVVSQFTLYGDASRGRRPDFSKAASPQKAKVLYEEFVDALKKTGNIKVETGEFQSHMSVRLINDGPVTIMLEV